MKQLNSHLFESVYKDLDIDLDKLGCIMLDIDGKNIPNLIEEENLYFTPDDKKFWIKGFVAGKTPHLTLLYGLLESGLVWEKQVKTVLEGWDLPSVTVKEVGYFESPYENEPYYCIVAHIEITPKLLEGHQRLEFLPHINTFAGYKAHLTLAYVKKYDIIRDNIINLYNKALKGSQLTVTGINLGGNH